MTKNNETLYEFFINNKIDWRFPNEYGLGENNLDCRQLSIMEVLRWRGNKNIIPVFLNSYDCFHKGILIRRSQPLLQCGWSINPVKQFPQQDIDKTIRTLIDQEGYCLLSFNAFQMKLSNYYKVHDVTHWCLVLGYDEDYIYIADTSGIQKFFSNSIGKIPWAAFLDAWDRLDSWGISVIDYSNDECDNNSSNNVSKLLYDSVQSMKYEGGLKELSSFISTLENSDLRDLVSVLEQLEFDIHYFRRLRNLWKTAFEKHAVPEAYVVPGLVEENMNVTKYWSLVMGVLMKWKRQPYQDYREKLFGYLREAYLAEVKYFDEMEKTIGGI